MCNQSAGDVISDDELFLINLFSTRMHNSYNPQNSFVFNIPQNISEITLNLII